MESGCKKIGTVLCKPSHQREVPYQIGGFGTRLEESSTKNRGKREVFMDEQHHTGIYYVLVR